MPAVGSRTMRIKVTDEEYERLEALDETRGQTHERLGAGRFW
jgi:predicted DNA-binding protein